MSAAPAASIWRNSTAIGNALLWLLGPGFFAVTGFLYRYDGGMPIVGDHILCLIVGQPMFGMAWALFALAEPRFRRDWMFWLLSLHVPYAAVLLILPVAAAGPDGTARDLFGCLLLGHWGLTGILGVLCFWRLLHPTPAAARTGAS